MVQTDDDFEAEIFSQRAGFKTREQALGELKRALEKSKEGKRKREVLRRLIELREERGENWQEEIMEKLSHIVDPQMLKLLFSIKPEELKTIAVDPGADPDVKQIVQAILDAME